MKITVLGTRANVEVSVARHSKHSGILIDGTLLFDLGEQSFLAHNPSAVFITHLHPDHAYFARHNERMSELNAPVYAPEVYAADKWVTVLHKPLVFKGYTITPIPTEHSLKVKSQAYLIEKDGVRILYTGDLFWIEKKHHHLLGKLDLVITDGSYLKEGGMIRRSKVCSHEENECSCTLSGPFGHTGIPDLIKFFAPFTKQMVFIHFGSWFYRMGAYEARAAIKKLGREHGVEAHVGYDGMELTVKKKGVR